jgi:hypothetical protein
MSKHGAKIELWQNIKDTGAAIKRLVVGQKKQA